MNFFEKLEKKAAAFSKKIVFPESADDRVLRAVSIIAKRALALPVLLGPEEEILRRARALDCDLSLVEITDHLVAHNRVDFAETFYEIRREKGMTFDQAVEIMKNPLYYGAMMAYKNIVHGMVAGSLSTTSDLLHAAFQTVGIQKNISKASSLFIMKRDDELLFFADCAVNADPSAQELASIALSSADTIDRFGVSPRVAFLSFSTHGSASHLLVDKVRSAKQFFSQLRPDLHADGEIQFDAAYVPEVARKKAPNSPIRGNANVFIFPDLNSGNIAYKIAERLGGFQAIGPILQGLQKPINDLSRGCSIEDIVNMAIITANQG